MLGSFGINKQKPLYQDGMVASKPFIGMGNIDYKANQLKYGTDGGIIGNVTRQLGDYYRQKDIEAGRIAQSHIENGMNPFVAKETARFQVSDIDLPHTTLATKPIKALVDKVVPDAAKMITLNDLVGKKVVPIPADLTKAGGQYTGIDSARTDPVELMGGHNYPLLKSSQDRGLVWANKGKGEISKIKKAKDDEGFVYGVVTNMNRDTHASNNTAVHAIAETIRAYEREGRLTKGNAKKITTELRKVGRELAKHKNPDEAKIGKELSKVPDFYDMDKTLSYIDSMTFDGRKRLIDEMRKTNISSIKGMPNINKILDEIVEPEYAGGNWGDGQMVIKMNANDLVDLSQDGIKKHPSYDYGVSGEVVGKLGRPVAYDELFPDFINQRRADGKPESADMMGFMRARPVQEITDELASKFPTTPYKSIQSHQQAKMVADAATDGWRSSMVSKKDGGISIQNFIDAIANSKASSTLDEYSRSALQKEVNAGKTTIYQLGDSQAFFKLKKGYSYKNEYGIDNPALTDNEIHLGSVINNEKNAPKTGGLLIAKAIEDGATVLDAYAVPSAKYPKGFLTEYYQSFGFEEVERIPFDPKYVEQPKFGGSKFKYNDIKEYWKSTGWDESMGLPDIVVMKWKGADDERAGFTSNFLQGSGRFSQRGRSALDGKRVRNVGENGGKPLQRDNTGRSGGDGVRGEEPRRSGTNDLQRVYGEILELSEPELRNIKIDPSRIQLLKKRTPKELSTKELMKKAGIR